MTGWDVNIFANIWKKGKEAKILSKHAFVERVVVGNEMPIMDFEELFFGELIVNVEIKPKSILKACHDFKE